MDYADVPAEIVARLASICLALPETTQEPAWAGTRWRVRKRTIAHVLTIDSEKGPATVMTFRSDAPERDALVATGHPFFKAGWGHNVVGMVLGDGTDWEEVGELLTESYCIMAPRRLAALVAPLPE